MAQQGKTIGVKKVLAALRAHKGMVYLAARSLGCTAQTIYNYRDKYPEVRQVMEQEDGEINDTAELKLYNAILTGEPWAIRFRLATKAKDRGYSERTEVTGANGGAIQSETTQNIRNLSDDDLDRLLADATASREEQTTASGSADG